MDQTALRNLYNRAQINDRQINELIGLARGILADGAANQSEAEYLYKWLAANKDAAHNPVVGTLFSRVAQYLSDGVLDDVEAAELLETLNAFSGGDFELGEALKAATLPLCSPAPEISFGGRRFCLTGTFAYGSRRECEQAIENKGGSCAGVSRKIHYLVIGAYATDSWAHSAYGRKIEAAAALRSEGTSISIVSEQHWRSFLG